LSIADLRLAFRPKPIGNRQLQIGNRRPTRYREVVLTSYHRKERYGTSIFRSWWSTDASAHSTNPLTLFKSDTYYAAIQTKRRESNFA
jgi:hypothetical protein